jgi:hypothetical protein
VRIDLYTFLVHCKCLFRWYGALYSNVVCQLSNINPMGPSISLVWPIQISNPLTTLRILNSYYIR